MALFLVLFTAVIVAPAMAADKTLKCKDCGAEFIYTDAEQKFNKGEKTPRTDTMRGLQKVDKAAEAEQ